MILIGVSAEIQITTLYNSSEVFAWCQLCFPDTAESMDRYHPHGVVVGGGGGQVIFGRVEGSFESFDLFSLPKSVQPMWYAVAGQAEVC